MKGLPHLDSLLGHLDGYAPHNHKACSVTWFSRGGVALSGFVVPCIRIDCIRVPCVVPPIARLHVLARTCRSLQLQLAYIEPCMLRFVLLYGGKSEFCFLPASWSVYGYGRREDL